MPDYEIAARARVARTFQNIRLFAGMTVLENLIVAQHNPLMEASGWTMPACSAAPLPGRRGQGRRARPALARQDRPDRARRRSGRRPPLRRPAAARDRARHVQRARDAVPRRAGGRPQSARVGRSQQLPALHPAEHGTSILLIEHDMSVVMEISDHVVVLEYGRKISDGPPDHVRNDPKVIAAYLGVEDKEVEKVEAEIAR